MKKQIAIVVGVITLVLVAGYSLSNLAQARNNCQEPNPNTKACLEQPQDDNNCTATVRANCTGGIYSIAQYPDGAVRADEGLTMTRRAICYYVQECRWSFWSGCYAVENWDATHYYGQKTVTNPDGVCPNE